jgi:hypothetical protein
MRLWLNDCRRQVCALLLVFCFSFVLGACGRKTGEIPVVPPVTPPLSRPVIGYGVVIVSYTYLVREPGEGGISLGYLRRGSLIRILERRVIRPGENTESWVLVERSSAPGQDRGWLKESVVNIYDNEFQANTAAESMTQ